MEFLNTLENVTNIKKVRRKQMGDVQKTGANLKIENKNLILDLITP